MTPLPCGQGGFVLHKRLDRLTIIRLGDNDKQ